MSEENDVSKPVIKKGRRISSVWIVPLIAALVGGWLYYKSTQESGQKIVLHFNDGGGIEAHKTHIMYRGVSVGIVESVSIRPENDSVLVEAELHHSARHTAVEGSEFWLVKPRIDLGGISGLDTLLSGNYIAIQPGKGDKKTVFKALDEPPAENSGVRGLKIVLLTDILNVASKGNPIYYRRIPVGVVQSHELASEKNSIRIHALIYEKFADLVRSDSRFWDVSGFEVNAGLDGIKIRAESVASLLAGGIAFDTPLHLTDSPSAEPGTEFSLYKDEKHALRRGTHITLHMNSSEGLRQGSLLKYKGFPLGEIEKLTIHPNLEKVTAGIFLEDSAAAVATEGSLFWVVKPKVGLAGVSGLDTIVTGNYIEVKPGHGEPAYEFTLLKQPPHENMVVESDSDPDFNLELVAPRLGSIKPGLPIFFRDIQVGQVSGANLSPYSDSVRIQISIKNQYAPLIREHTHFYNASGFGVDLGLLGATFKAASMSAILEGGIGFATPGTSAKPAEENSLFILFDEPEKEWLTWAPTIEIPNDVEEEQIMVNQLLDQSMIRKTKDLRSFLGFPAKNESEPAAP